MAHPGPCRHRRGTPVTRLLVDLLGWIGAGALLSAYALVSTGRLQGRGLAFQALNLVGAAGLLINGVYHGAWPSAGLNTVWLVVGMVALARLHATRRFDSRQAVGPPGARDTH